MNTLNKTKKAREDADKAHADFRRREIDDIKALLKTEEGRRFIGRIARYGDLFGANTSRNADVYAREARRAMATVFVADAEVASPGFTSELMAEFAKSTKELYIYGEHRT